MLRRPDQVPPSSPATSQRPPSQSHVKGGIGGIGKRFLAPESRIPRRLCGLHSRYAFDAQAVVEKHHRDSPARQKFQGWHEVPTLATAWT